MWNKGRRRRQEALDALAGSGNQMQDEAILSGLRPWERPGVMRKAEEQRISGTPIGTGYDTDTDGVDDGFAARAEVYETYRMDNTWGAEPSDPWGDDPLEAA